MGVVQALHFMNEIRYPIYRYIQCIIVSYINISNGVRSHERGGHSTGPFLEITLSLNVPFNKFAY